MFCIKSHKKFGEVMVAACDREIVGNEYEEDELRISIDRSFYFERIAGVDELMGLLEDATIANLVGNNVVEAAIENGFVDEKNVLVIDGIKHAQIVRV